MNAGLGCQISICIFLLLVTSHVGVRAQSNGTATPAPALASPASADARWDLNIVNGSLRRQDGKTVPATLGNVIDYMRDLFPANIVLAPGVGQIKVGDFKLASFQWEPALDALRVASDNAFQWKRRSDSAVSGMVDPTTGMPVPRSLGGDSNAGSELLMLTLDDSGEIPGPRRVVEVFNLGGYLRGQDKEKQEKNLNEIMQIVEVTLRDFDSGRDGNPSLRFRFHAGASLLVVNGSPGEVEVARKVILALPETSSSKAQSSSPDDAARARFLQRYGLNPAVPPQPSPASEPFLRRYGLSPTPPSQPDPPADPVAPVAPPAPKR